MYTDYFAPALEPPTYLSKSSTPTEYLLHSGLHFTARIRSVKNLDIASGAKLSFGGAFTNFVQHYCCITSMEVAGLVLGAIPLAITLLDKYLEGIGRIEKAWRIQALLKDYRTDLGVAKERLSGFYVVILDGILSDDELQRVTDDPCSVEWTFVHGPALRKKLGSSKYELIDDIFGEIRDVLSSIKEGIQSLGGYPVCSF